MRKRGLLVSVLVIAACGGSSSKRDGGATHDSAVIDSPVVIDSPPGTPDAAAPACTHTPVMGNVPLAREVVADNLSNPVLAISPPGDVRRLFIIEKTLANDTMGDIRIVKDGNLLPTPFLTITGLSHNINEEGLLGLAFHPQYATNGKFYINYTDSAGDTHVVEYRASADPDIADPSTANEILFESQPFVNHNGGDMAFGPDGYLYVGFGDGGSGGDPMGNGQNLGTLLGKMIRIDVDNPQPPLAYGIPTDNPFVASPTARGEIWDYGLRNPWRWSFDKATGDLYIGDVGQNNYEEVDFEPAHMGGVNYGWVTMEGTHCYPAGTTGCNMSGKQLPIQEFDHGAGTAVIGGYVYRGCRMPAYAGTYFYSDLSGGFVKSLVMSGGSVTNVQDQPMLAVGTASSFGQDAEGEVYIIDLGGTVYRIAPAP